MSRHNDITFPPLIPSQKQRHRFPCTLPNFTVQTSEEGQEEGESSGAVQHPARKSYRTDGNYLYAGPGRKPRLLMHLESYVNKELHTLSPHEPKFQELKLQVYREVFGCFIKEFKTYQSILSAIKKVYETFLAYQRDQIQALEPLRSHLRLVTEECDRKIQARWAEEQTEIATLIAEKQQLQRDIEAMREREKAKQAVIDRLQSELSSQYLLYREERDARKLLIRQLNEQRSGSVEEEHPADENKEEGEDGMGLQLTLKACHTDLTKAQEELNRMKAESVPRRDWDTLEHTHNQTLLQLKTLQRDFDLLKSEHDALLKLQRSVAHEPITAQTGDSVCQEQNQLKAPPTDSDAAESSTLTVQEFRAALRTAFPLKSDQEIDELVASAQSDPDRSSISCQTLHSLVCSSGGFTQL